MPKRPLESLGAAVRVKRSGRKLREVAAEVGISPATLMRVENGRVPDLGTFAKLCQWLELDPGDFLGRPESTGSGTASEGGPLVMSAHFRAEQTPNEKTVAALARMLLTAAGIEPRANSEASGNGGV